MAGERMRKKTFSHEMLMNGNKEPKRNLTRINFTLKRRLIEKAFDELLDILASGRIEKYRK